MTLKECKEMMCHMWHWLYQNPKCNKLDYFNSGESHKLYDKYKQHEDLDYCAACEYDGNQRDFTEPYCIYCPVPCWDHEYKCMHESAYFFQWEKYKMEEKYMLSKHYALEIYKQSLMIKIDCN